MALVWRILIVLALINSTVLVVFVFLVTIQFEAVLSGSIQERLEVIVENVRDPFTSVSDLGLPLSSLRNANAMLERVKQDDEAIETIHVYDSSGQILHSTDKSPSKSVTNSVLLAGSKLDVHGLWYLEDALSYKIGAVIVDLAENPIGGVAVQYSKKDAITQVRAMSARLSFYCAIGFIATLLVSLVVLRLAMYRHIRLDGTLLEAFDSFERFFWRTPGGTEQERHPVNALGVDSAEFRRLLDQSEVKYKKEKQHFIKINGEC